jgi:hypothetical protein
VALFDPGQYHPFVTDVLGRCHATRLKPEIARGRLPDELCHRQEGVVRDDPRLKSRIVFPKAMADNAATASAEDTPVANTGGQKTISENNVKFRNLRLLANPTWQDLLSFTLSASAVISIIVFLILLGWDTFFRRTIVTAQVIV